MKKLIIALLITLCPFTAWAGCPVNELIYNTLTPITFSFEKRNGTGEDTANTANKKLSLSYWNGSAWRWVGSDNLWDDTTETQLAMIQITGSQYYFNIPAAALSSTVSGQYIAIRFDEADDVDVTMSCVAYVQPQDRIIDTDNVGINWGDVSNPTTTVGLTNTTIPWNPAWDVEVESESTDALNAYDPPTRAELTTDKDSIITEVNANETKMDSLGANLYGIDTFNTAFTGSLDAMTAFRFQNGLIIGNDGSWLTATQ